MEVPDKIHPLGWLRKQLEADGGTDLIREMVQAFAEVLMSAEASALCGAGYGERSEERVNSRNGYRTRAFDTRAGSMSLAIPKLRHDTYLGHVLEHGVALFLSRSAERDGGSGRLIHHMTVSVSL